MSDNRVSLTAEQVISSWENRTIDLLKQNVIFQAMIEKIETQHQQLKDELVKYMNEAAVLSEKVKLLELQLQTPELPFAKTNKITTAPMVKQ